MHRLWEWSWVQAKKKNCFFNELSKINENSVKRWKSVVFELRLFLPLFSKLSKVDTPFQTAASQEHRTPFSPTPCQRTFFAEGAGLQCFSSCSQLPDAVVQPQVNTPKRWGSLFLSKPYSWNWGSALGIAGWKYGEPKSPFPYSWGNCSTPGKTNQEASGLNLIYWVLSS